MVELNNTPPSSSGINYAGWNRNVSEITQTTIIHHPQGDVMKITTSNSSPVFGNYPDNIRCWHLNTDHGTTEGGSSGAPYFDQNHRLIGHHVGVGDNNKPICDQVSKYAGRFDVSWIGEGTNSTRVSNWLDSGNTGAISTNTTGVSQLFGNPIEGPSVLCNSNIYSVSINPSFPVSWSANPSNHVSLTPNDNKVIVAKIFDGSVTLTASITGLCENYTISKTIWVGVPSVSGNFHIRPVTSHAVL